MIHNPGRSAAIAASLLAALAACSAPLAQAPAAEAAVVATLIVKPRAATSEESAVIGPMRAALGPTAGVRYVRPMAGDAHIVYLTSPAKRDDVDRLIERLRASGSFQFVELDSMLKTQ